MPNIKVVNMAGQEVGELALSDKIFGAAVNEAVLHTAVRAYLSNQRQGTQSTLTRTEVSGGGRKPWKQKGTGHARQGSTRAPQWTHGGIALGPKPRDYHITMNKKVKKVALISALSAKVAAGELIVVDNITAETYKTAPMVEMLKAIGCEKEVTKKYRTISVVDGEVVKENGLERTETVPTKALIVLSAPNQVVVKSCANIPGVKVVAQDKNKEGLDIMNLNVYDILSCEHLVVAKDAIAKIEEVYAR